MKHSLSHKLSAALLSVIPLSGAFAAPVAQAPQSPTQAAAPSAPAATDAQKMKQAYQEQLNDGRLMIANISIALMALEQGATDIAGKDVDNALSLARKLEQSAPEIKSTESMRFGKLTHEAEGTVRVFYVPVADDNFMVHGFETSGHNNDKIRETDAQMVHAHVSLDVRKAISGLTEAKSALDKSDAVAAEKALTGVLSGAMTDEVTASEPLHVAHDNLILAQNLLSEKRFASARFALENAQKGLSDYKPSAHDSDLKTHVDQMNKAISTLTDQLRKEDPTALQHAGDTVKRWATELRNYLNHPHKSPPHTVTPVR